MFNVLKKISFWRCSRNVKMYEHNCITCQSCYKTNAFPFCYTIIKTEQAYIQGLYNTVRVLGSGCCIRRDSSNEKYTSTGLPPELWCQLEGEEVGGLTSWAKSAVAGATMSLEAMKAPPVQGMQKPARRVGEKWLLDRILEAPELQEEKPGGLKMRPAW
jgi:hypothetical protein